MKTRFLIILGLCAPVLTGGCAVVGPASISNGRMAYTEVINYTEDQQLLNAIVRERYGQTFGLLSVTSVAANVKFRGSADAEFNTWNSDEFTDQLTPLSLGAAYEENPTISYLPVQGEAVLRSLVTPFSIQESFLLLSAAKERHILNRFLYRRLNDLKLPVDGPLPPEAQRDIDVGFMLRDADILRFGRAPIWTAERPEYVLILSGYSEEHYDAVREYLDLFGIEGQVSTGGRSCSGSVRRST